tara:strand:- start:524 stop:688 length:165 start_codon:yes stop_codon:yes gene_type:complete
MDIRHRKAKKTSTSLPLESEIGLSSYDLALISLAKKYKRTKRLKKEDYQELLAS